MNAPSLVQKLCRVLSNSYSGNLPAISSIPWITDKILEAVFQKAAPRLAKDTKEWRRLCSVVRVKTKGDRERYMYQFGSEAEEGLSNKQLKGAFRAIAEISGKISANQQCPIIKDYGQPCASKEETRVRWQEHHTTMFNHPPATACQNLNQDVACACSVCSDAPSLQRSGTL